MGRYKRLADKPYGSNEATQLNRFDVPFNISGLIPYLDAHIRLDLRESGGSAATTDTGLLNALDIELYVKGLLRHRWEGATRQVNYGVHAGEIGILQFADYGCVPQQHGNGDASVALSTTESRDVDFRLAVGLGADDIGKDAHLSFIWGALSRWTSGGTINQDATRVILSALQVEQMEFALRSARISKSALSASTTNEVPIPPSPAKGAELIDIVLTNVRGSTLEYEDGLTIDGAVTTRDIVSIQLVANSEVILAEWLMPWQADMALKAKAGRDHYFSYAATPLRLENRRGVGGFFEGVYYLETPPVVADDLKMIVTTGSGIASTSEWRGICRYRVPTGVGSKGVQSRSIGSSPTGPEGSRTVPK